MKMKTMRRPNLVFGCIAFVCVAFLCVALFLVASFFASTQSQPDSGPLSAAAVFAAIAALLTTLAIQSLAHEFNRSEFYLHESVKGFQRAYELLEDGNNDRATWIGCARILQRVKTLGKSITIPEHCAVYELELDYQRRKFRPFLEQQPSFYYGVVDRNLSLDEAAALSTTPNGALGSPDTGIDESTLCAISDVIRYPKGYADPHPDATFSDVELRREEITLGNYVKHRRKHLSSVVTLLDEI